MAEYLGEEAIRSHEKMVKDIMKARNSHELSSAMGQDLNSRILGHRIYHEAPDDVFQMILSLLSDMGEDALGRSMGKGGLNVLRLVNKRCMQSVETVATRFTYSDTYGVNRSLIFCLPAVLERCKKIEHILCDNLLSLEGCPVGVKSLIFTAHGLESLGPLSNCKELEHVNISFGKLITDLSPLSSCQKLKTLIVMGTGVTDLSPLSSLSLLEVLNFYYVDILDLAPLSQCKNLKLLKIGHSERIEDLGPLSQCPNLEELIISGLPLIKNLSFFEKGFKMLRILELGLQVDDLSLLTRLQNLELFVFYNRRGNFSLLPLAQCYKLKRLDCFGKATEITELKNKRPDMKIETDEDWILSNTL